MLFWVNLIFVGISFNIKFFDIIAIPVWIIIWVGIYTLLAICPNCGVFLVKIYDLFSVRNYHRGVARTILGRRNCPKCGFTYKQQLS